MSQINTRLRTYNYHIVSRENKNAKLALAEAQKALRQAESELEKAEAEVKEAQTEANAFQLIADAIKFKTSINQLIIKVEAEVSEEGAIPVFKGETGTTPNEKELEIKGLVIEKTETENVYKVYIELAEPVVVINQEDNVVLATLEKLTAIDAIIKPNGDDPQEIGDFVKCFPIEGALAADPVWFKQSLPSSLGDPVNTKFAFKVDNYATGTPASFQLNLIDANIELQPIPSEAQ